MPFVCKPLAQSKIGLTGSTEKDTSTIVRTISQAPYLQAEAGPQPHTVAMNANTRATAARAFVRSLNILLKFARMYDFGHPRTKKQYETAWSELRMALGSEDRSGLLLAVS